MSADYLPRCSIAHGGLPCMQALTTAPTPSRDAPLRRATCLACKRSPQRRVPQVRLAAVQALSHLKPWKLEQLVPRVIELLQHADSGVRYTSLEVLSELK